MMIRLIAVALGGMAATSAASAQDAQPRNRVDAVVRCLDIATTDERLRCYDAAATALREGVQRGEVVAKPPPTPSRVDARVASASVRGGRWELVLDNGQTWRTWEAKEQRPPAAGSTVRIGRNLIGSYWMRVPGVGQIRVERVQ